MNTQLFAVFLPTDNLHLLDCAVTWSLLMRWRNNTDWTCWLTVDARVLKHKHRFETDSDSSHPVHPKYTTCKQYTAACVNNGRTAESSAAVSWRHHMLKICYLRDFKKLPNQNSIDIPMQTSKALFVANSKISTNAHLVRICLKMGVQGMFCSSKLQVK